MRPGTTSATAVPSRPSLGRHRDTSLPAPTPETTVDLPGGDWVGVHPAAPPLGIGRWAPQPPEPGARPAGNAPR